MDGRAGSGAHPMPLSPLAGQPADSASLIDPGRLIADYYALQRSRRQLGASDLKASSDVDDGSGSSLNGASSHGDDSRERNLGRGGGIRSSWHGGGPNPRRREHGLADLAESTESQPYNLSPISERNGMMDIGLEDTLRSEYDDDPPEDLMENPPSIQQLRKPNPTAGDAYDSDESEQENAQRRLLGHARNQSGGDDSVPESVQQPLAQQPKHDAFWGQLYLLALTAMFATWFLVFLHTQSPSTNQPLGDTIYTT